MRILFDTYLPFSFAHGGVQVRYEHTVRALRELGIEAMPLEWWSSTLPGDVVHYFGRPTAHYIEFAQAKGVPVVFTDLLGALAARPPRVQRLQRLAMTAARALVPSAMLNRLAWDAFHVADACIAQTQAEADLMIHFLGAPSSRVHVIPNGVDELFAPDPSVSREDWLLCVATLRPLKRVVELAEAGAAAGVPTRFVGKPYSPEDPYYARFMSLVKRHDEVIYEGPARDRDQLADLYRRARGFVLLSTLESYSLASAEAAACGCPLLLSDLPWARSVYGANASYCRLRSGVGPLANTLRRFHAEAVTAQPPPTPLSWEAVARKLIALYESVCHD